MPYVIIHEKGGYKVEKEGTDKTFSKKPMPKARAEAQMRAMYAAEGRKKKK